MRSFRRRTGDLRKANGSRPGSPGGGVRPSYLIGRDEKGEDREGRGGNHGGAEAENNHCSFLS